MPLYDRESLQKNQHGRGFNRIDTFFESDGCEVSIRIDARTDDRAFIATVCTLAKRLGCSLHAQELDETIPAETDAIVEALTRSASWRFALDPKAFIRDLGRG